MARKPKKAEDKPKSKKKDKGKGKAEAKKPKKRAAVILRRNAAPSRARAPDKAEALAKADDDARTPIVERIEDMGGSHVAAAVIGGSIGNVVGVIAAAQGWIGPKWAAGVLMGGGLSAMAAGWYWEKDHVMATGAGVTAAGAFSMVNQVAVDAYEAVERKAEEKRARKEAEEAEKERKKRLDDARALLEDEAKKKATRNARRIVILDRDGEPIDADFEEVEPVEQAA